MDEGGSQEVGIGNMPLDARTDPRPVAPARIQGDRPLPSMEMLFMLGGFAEASWLPTVSFRSLDRQARREFVESIRMARKLDPDDVAAYHFGLPDHEKRQLYLAHVYGSGVDWAEYAFLRQGNTEMTHDLALALSVEAKRVIVTGEVTLPPQR